MQALRAVLISVAALFAVAALAPLLAQTVALNDDVDPLTPKSVVGQAPQAPGAPATVAKSGVAVDPVIVLAQARLAEAQHGKITPAEKHDREALAAFYAENGGQPVWTSPAGPTPRATAAVGELAEAASFGLSGKDVYRVPEVATAFTSAEAQAEHELAVGLAVLSYARHARGERLDPSALSRMIDRKSRPFEPKSVLAALAASDDVGATLRRFHPQHVGFQRLQTALVAALQSHAPAEVIQRLAVNLERWRWMPDDLGAFHIVNNIPEQLTRVYRDGAVVLTEKIVVGKPGSPTPNMSADMQFVIFHPSWGVPAGIKEHEVGPMLARASARNQSFFGEGGHASRALARHELRVSHNGREVNPDSIDWTRADVRQFHFSQPPSSKNVLGVVKFRFPNRYDVYMHDTQERNLFNAGTRAFSHGCMRVQNPIHLAEVILAQDKGWSAERVRSHVPGGRSADITLNTPVPVHLVYFTATVDDAGKLLTHGDIYGMDARVASALAGKPVSLAAAKVDTPAQPRRERNARAKETSASFNPFAGLFGN